LGLSRQAGPTARSYLRGPPESRRRSGGQNRAFGAVEFTGGQEPSATKITCILPYEDRDLCTVIVEDWIRRLAASTP
jgi:hypothetical protein